MLSPDKFAPHPTTVPSRSRTGETDSETSTGRPSFRKRTVSGSRTLSPRPTRPTSRRCAACWLCQAALCASWLAWSDAMCAWWLAAMFVAAGIAFGVYLYFRFAGHLTPLLD